MGTRFPIPNIFGIFRKVLPVCPGRPTDTGGNVVDTSTT